jgi:hypothetical protein
LIFSGIFFYISHLPLSLIGVWQAAAYDTILRLERACRNALLSTQGASLLAAAPATRPLPTSTAEEAVAHFERLKRLLPE